MNNAFLFLSFYDENYSRTAVKIEELKRRGFWVDFEKIPTNLFQLISKLISMRSKSRQIQHLIVMSPSHLLVIFSYLVLGKKPVLDAGWPLSDSTFRGNLSVVGLRAWLRNRKSLLVDKISFRLAGQIYFESEKQRDRVCKKFQILETKCFVSYTGVQERRFNNPYLQVERRKVIEKQKNSEKYILMFRGKRNSEAGLDVISSLIRRAKPELFYVVLTNQEKPQDLQNENCLWISDWINDSEIACLYQLCDFCVGQMGSDERIQFTVAHKAFEAAFFNKPYVGRKSDALNELFGEENYLALESIPISRIEELIIRTLESPEKVWSMQQNIKSRYNLNFSQKAITDKFLEDLQKYIQARDL